VCNFRERCINVFENSSTSFMGWKSYFLHCFNFPAKILLVVPVNSRDQATLGKHLHLPGPLQGLFSLLQQHGGDRMRIA